MGGVVKNHSSKTLWVIETDSGPAIAHKLKPNKRSPIGVDADGFKALDGTLVNDHHHWVKVSELSTADVRDMASGQLDRGCILCMNVEDNEFGPVTFSMDEGWGVTL